MESNGSKWLAINVSISMVVFTLLMLVACGIFLTLIVLTANSGSTALEEDAGVAAEVIQEAEATVEVETDSE